MCKTKRINYNRSVLDFHRLCMNLLKNTGVKLELVYSDQDKRSYYGYNQNYTVELSADFVDHTVMFSIENMKTGKIVSLVYSDDGYVEVEKYEF